MIESIKKKLEQKCPKVAVSAMHISSLLYAIQEIILEDRLETGYYTKDQLVQECFKRGIPQSHINLIQSS